VEPTGVCAGACSRSRAESALPGGGIGLCWAPAAPRASSGAGSGKRVRSLSSLLGSVQRPHSDGEKRNEAEQPATDPDPDAAASALRSECLSRLARAGRGCAAPGPAGPWLHRPRCCVEGGRAGLRLPGPSLPTWARLPSLQRRGRVSPPPPVPAAQPASCPAGGKGPARLSAGLILTSLLFSPCFSFSDRFHADGIPAQPIPYSQAPVPHRTGPRSHGHAKRRSSGPLLPSAEPCDLQAQPALPAAACCPGKKQPGRGVAYGHARPSRDSRCLHPPSARPGGSDRRSGVSQAAAGR